jgi:hypothetical protein
MVLYKYVKQGSSKYPQKSSQKKREGEDQLSPKLEVMGSVQMVGDKCGGVYGAGGEVMMLWERGKGCRSGGLEAGGRITHYCLPQHPKTWATQGVFWNVKGTWEACRCLGK